MADKRGLKQDILNLRRQGYTYNQILDKLKCSKNTVYYHCKKNNLNDMGYDHKPLAKEIADEIFEFCKTKKIREAVEHFNLSESTIKKYKKGIS